MYRRAGVNRAMGPSWESTWLPRRGARPNPPQVMVATMLTRRKMLRRGTVDPPERVGRFWSEVVAASRSTRRTARPPTVGHAVQGRSSVPEANARRHRSVLSSARRGSFAPGTPVAAEAVADGSAGADGRRRRARPCGSRTPVSPPASPSRRPPRPSSSQVLDQRPPGGPEPARPPATAALKPDVLPTAGGRLADWTRTFTPPAPGDLSTPSEALRPHGGHGDYRSQTFVCDTG